MPKPINIRKYMLIGVDIPEAALKKGDVIVVNNMTARYVHEGKTAGVGTKAEMYAKKADIEAKEKAKAAKEAAKAKETNSKSGGK